LVLDQRANNRFKSVSSFVCGFGTLSSQISAILPTYNRPARLRDTLQRILACDPAPAEVIVHVDAGDTTSGDLIRTEFPDVRLLESAERVGPGGGRNRLVAAASCPLVASFDDDSYPVDLDYFARLEMVFDRYPRVAVLAAVVFNNGDEMKPGEPSCRWVADFGGGGCAYRRDVFLDTTGYVPMPIAYGMEEVDLALRLHGSGWGILQSPWLRVRHETDRRHQQAPAVTAASVANISLLAYLRYPISRWWVSVGQTMNMVWYLLRNNRRRGIVAGLGRIPGLARRYSSYRGPVTASALDSYLRLRRRPVDAGMVLKQQGAACT
jgi:GT2 family glycosyltransferase